jgi:hypothetical protein
MFNPLHKLAHCQKLRQVVDHLKNGGAIPAAVLDGHHTYHYALVHKLKSAQWHFNRLSEHLQRSDATAAVQTTDFIATTNMHLDGFFYSAGSALDILAREVLVYFNIPLPPSVYFRTAREELTRLRPADTLIGRLQDPTWKTEFSNYRNALTHELLIGTRFQINAIQAGGNIVATIQFPLPDDPRNPRTSTYNRNPNALEYCETTLKRILSLVNTIHGEIHTRASAAGALPL